MKPSASMIYEGFVIEADRCRPRSTEVAGVFGALLDVLMELEARTLPKLYFFLCSIDLCGSRGLIALKYGFVGRGRVEVGTKNMARVGLRCVTLAASKTS